MRKQLLAALFAVLSVVQVAWAEPPSSGGLQGGDLLDDCRLAEATSLEARSGIQITAIDRRALGFLRCTDYLDGFLGANIVARGTGREPLFCLPPGDPLDAARHAFITYAEAHPELHHLGRNSLLYYALADAFPCRH